MQFPVAKKDWLLAIVVMLISTCTLSAQENKTIKGIIASSKDALPVPGANVLVKGTNTVAVTDFNGEYSINASPNREFLPIPQLEMDNNPETIQNDGY